MLPLSDPIAAAVLAVDDNPSNLRSLEAVLGELGANLVTAQSGDEALMRLLERDFAVILLDIQMPGLDGFETAQLIRSRQRSRHTPIIFLTAYQYSETDVERGYALGAVDFLFKPMSLTVLRSKVSVFLELHRKTEAVRRQALMLEEATRRAHERELQEVQAQWEKERLQQEMERERRVSEALNHKATELARTVAERRSAEEALQRTNQRLRLLADAASSLLIEPKPESCLERICKGMAEHVGLDAWLAYKFDETQKCLLLTSHFGVPDAACAAFRQLPSNGGPTAAAAIAEQPVIAEGDGQAVANWGPPWDKLGLSAAACFPMLAQGAVLGALVLGSRTRSGFGSGEIAVMHTVADQIAMAMERGRLIEELRSRNEALRTADQRKDEFLAMLGHELRNPLTPVVNTLHLLQVKGVVNEEIRAAVDAANRQALHMVRLLADLLDVSRITSGKIELQRKHANLAATIEDAVQATRPLVTDKKHQLLVELPPGSVTIDVDTTRFAQIISNLINNAARYTDPGGRIDVVCSIEGDDLIVQVKDNGVGIDPSALDLIFDTFVQVNPTSDRAAGGLGLGLTLVKRLAEMHGGTVVARSAGRGSGCEFEVRLPVIVDRLQHAQDRQSLAGIEQLSPLRILLVEDNEDIRMTLRQLLELNGHTVEEASDGRMGLELIVSSEPQVAFVDIGLPGLDGYEVARQVRQAQATQHTRLVALSGYSGEDVRRRVRESGFDAHLVKPVGLNDLRRVLSEVQATA